MKLIFIEKSLSKNEKKESLRIYMWRHQFLDIKEEAKVMHGFNMQGGTQRFENYV